MKPNPFYSQNKSLAFPVHYPTETIHAGSFLLFIKVSFSEGIFMMMPIKNLPLISLQTGALTCISNSFTVTFNKENILKKTISG